MLAGRTALLVDDDARNLFALGSVLERRGMHVLTATTGKEALAIVRSHPNVAIVLMDIMMPEMDGYQTIAAIRRDLNLGRLPIIALTAKAMKGDREKCLEAGASEYLAKPVNTDQLLDRAAHVAAPVSERQSMAESEKVNILLVDDQPGKLLSYEVILKPLGHNLIRTSSGREALAALLKTEVAVVLIDVEMPEIDGFELAAMIREHPRFGTTAIIFVSAVHLTTNDTVRGYAMGAVDYVPVPVIPEVLRAKVRVFIDLYRKTRMLERFNEDLERRVGERTTELEDAMNRLTILANEVDHRAKNALAVVQSIVRLTRSKNIDAYRSTVEGRIGALARSHTLLAESRWEGADLLTIMEDEMAPYRTGDAERISVSGPQVMLQPAAAQSLALVIHELATNAVKYGALSSPNGRLSAVFRLRSNSLDLDWEERGGPEIDEPQTAGGFGTRLISASLEQLRGHAEFEWSKPGLKCRLTVPRGRELEKMPA